jgi:hypothetical protein
MRKSEHQSKEKFTTLESTSKLLETTLLGVAISE